MVDKDAAQKGYPYSYIEELWDEMYLEGRWSLPINSNPYLALKPPPDRAAVAGASDPQITGATRWVCVGYCTCYNRGGVLCWWQPAAGIMRPMRTTDVTTTKINWHSIFRNSTSTKSKR